MSLAPGWRPLFRLPFDTRRSLEREVDDELAFHLAMREEKLRRLGWSPADARLAVVSRFGDPARIRNECIDIDQQHAREGRIMELFQTLISDVRYAARTLRARPTFTAIAALTLALGIGASSAMFSLVDGILLRPLPFPHADRLVDFRQAYPEKGLDRWSLSQANVTAYRDRVKDFDSFAAYQRSGATLQGDGRAERLVVEVVTVDYFKVLGVGPAIGRAFSADEGTKGNDNVGILSYAFWQSRFGGDRAIVGKSLDLNGQPTRVIGIMAPDFTFPRPDVQMYLPLALDPSRGHPFGLGGIARLRGGASVDQAKHDATEVMYDWTRQMPGLVPATVDPRTTHMSALVTPLREAMTGNVTRPLAVLQAAVLVILLIAIANVATLLSSRASARGREMAMRAALGATRARLARQLLTESVALAALGGLIGIALAFVLVRAFTHSGVTSLPRVEEVGVDGSVLAFTVLISVASGVLFGLAPMWAATRPRIADSLAGQKSSAQGGARHLNNLLIVGQIGLSFVLLVSAGLMLKSFRHLMQTDLGFEPAGVTTLTMPLPPQRYGMNSTDQNVAFTTSVVDRVRAQPGVRAVGAIFPALYANDVNSDGFLVEGHAPPPGTSSETQTVQLSVTPGLLSTLEMRLLYGRDFTARDRSTTLPVVIVDDELAHRYWRGAEALGHRIRTTGDTTWLTIVGVVASIRDEDVARPARPHTFFPYAQSPGSRPTLVVRTSGAGAGPTEAIRRTIVQLDPGVALTNVRPLADAIALSLEQRRLTQALLTGFAALALILAGVGLYGVISLYVANRHREFGIRLAVGAAPSMLVQLVLREGVGLAVIGVALGAGGAALATRWVRALLYEVTTNDPIVFALLALALLGVAAVACYFPARRAAKSDPLIALRSD